MSHLSILEYELIDFFGSDFVSRQFGTEWFDSDSLYRYEDAEGMVITCAIHPIHKDARVTLSFQSHTYFDWQATGLADIIYEGDARQLRFVTPAGDALELRLIPKILVSHSYPFRPE